MSKILTFTELRHYIARWEGRRYSPATAYGILICIGYLRREALTEDELLILREVETLAKATLSTIISQYKIFMDGALLHEYAQQLSAVPDEDCLEQFFQLRDEMQMAFELLSEYAEESNHPTAIFSTVQDYLFEVDSHVLYHQKVVKGIQGLVAQEPRPPALDTEIFWWWGQSAYQETCWLPAYFRDAWIAAELDQVLDPPQHQLLHEHLTICPECREQYQMVTAMVTSSLPSNSLDAGSAAAPITPSCLVNLLRDAIRPYIQEASLAAAPYEEEIKCKTPDGQTLLTSYVEEQQVVIKISSFNQDFTGLQIQVKGPNTSPQDYALRPIEPQSDELYTSFMLPLKLLPNIKITSSRAGVLIEYSGNPCP